MLVAVALLQDAVTVDRDHVPTHRCGVDRNSMADRDRDALGARQKSWREHHQACREESGCADRDRFFSA
jgi:hypothetical protein